MSAPPDDDLRNWRARSWKEQRSIWEHLMDRTPPTFRGRRLTAQECGTVFERWIMEAFRLSGCPGVYPFEVPLRASTQTQEQIDGLVFDAWQGFIVESNCLEDKVDFPPIALFHARVVRRVSGTLGLFFSARGHTPAAIDCTEELRPIRILLFDGDDLRVGLPRAVHAQEQIDIGKLVRRPDRFRMVQDQCGLAQWREERCAWS